jgi:transcriptional regulator GlxA family with amidase domain
MNIAPQSRGFRFHSAVTCRRETPKPDVILLPGSEATTTTAMADGTLIAWLKQAHATSKWSVCSGAMILLAAAGILEGLPATTVRSGKVWTTAGVSAGIDFALALAAEIAGREEARSRGFASSTTRGHHSTRAIRTRPAKRCGAKAPAALAQPDGLDLDP